MACGASSRLCVRSFLCKREFDACSALSWPAGACYPEVQTFFPPSLEALLAWSVTFRSAGTLTNYLGYVRTRCMIVNVSTAVRAWVLLCMHQCFTEWWLLLSQVFADPALVKAKTSVEKAQRFIKREPLWLQRWAPVGVGLGGQRVASCFVVAGLLSRAWLLSVATSRHCGPLDGCSCWRMPSFSECRRKVSR